MAARLRASLVAIAAISAGALAIADDATPAPLPRFANTASAAPARAYSFCSGAHWSHSSYVTLLPTEDGPLLAVACADRVHVVRVSARHDGTIIADTLRSFVWTGYRDGDAPSAERPIAVDLESDGARDLVLPFRSNNRKPSNGGRGGRVHLAPIGPGLEWEETRAIARAQVADVAAGDLMRSRGPELAILDAGEPWADRDGHVLVTRNRARRVARRHHDAGLGPTSIALGDRDGDGHADVLIASAALDQHGHLRVLRGDGRGGLELALDRAIDGGWRMEAGDLDGNGTIDAVITGRSGTHVFRGALEDDPERLDVDRVTYALTTLDIGADGRAEIAMRMPDESVALLGAIGDRLARVTFVRLPRGLVAQDIAIADLDGDGDLDAAITVFRRGAASHRELLLVPDVPTRRALRAPRLSPLPTAPDRVDLP
ncbi:MAG: VCBS repeat-containing protein [Myxococcota bacterium]|nr:VCBS repeat-containing protein [Myxococcota bacterium]